MVGQVVKVKRDTLEACMTCPLCDKLLREATTISLCLHTFCRKCIYEKLSDEEVDCCPVCNIDLGCLPVEKLRPDHNLQDIRAKIFPLKRRKVQAPEVVPPISLPVKRKERSLSSLVVSTPKVSMQTGLTGKRTKVNARKAAALRVCGFSSEDKKEDSADDRPLSSSSPDSLNKTFSNKRQDSSKAETSNGQRPNDEDLETDVEIMEGKADLWTPLNCLVEAANRTKSSKLNSLGPSFVKSESNSVADSDLYMHDNKFKAESQSGPGSDGYFPRTKLKEHGQNAKFQDDKSGIDLLPGPVKRRRLRAAKKREAGAHELCAAAQAMLDASAAKYKRKNGPIWFSLIASEDQNGGPSLPQIPAGYLRIKDGKMPVSYIQKYIVKKLDLTSEAEVEILCRDQPVPPSLELHNLVDLWFRTGPTTKRVPASVGSSAKEFVMVLSYSRKVPVPVPVPVP